MGRLKIIVDKSAERGFIDRALAAFPNEYIEAIWGIKRGNTIYVHSFQHLDQKATTKDVEYASYESVEEESVLDAYVDGLDEHAEDAKAQGVRVLGKIHSHPWDDPTKFDKVDDGPSTGDIDDDIDEGHIVAGICLIRKHKNGRKYVTVAFWPKYRKLEKEYYPVGGFESCRKQKFKQSANQS